MSDAQLLLFPDIEHEIGKPKLPGNSAVQALPGDVQLVEAASVLKQAPMRVAKPPANTCQKGAGKVRAKAQVSKEANVLLTVRDVARQCTVSRATIWRWVKSANGFPQPLRLGPGTTRWRLQDVMAWQATRAATPTERVN